MMQHKNLDLTVAALADTIDRTYDLAILPWGAIEPHNLHLPYLTDAILAYAISVDVAQGMANEGVYCMVLPAVNFGSQNPGQREQPFCIHARYDTQRAILTDIVASLRAQGMQRLLIVNGHGGNNFKNMIRDLAVDFPEFIIASSEWYTVCKAADYFDAPGDHADELETSVMMYYRPELVDLTQAGEGRYKPFAVESLNDKVAWIPRNWQRVTDDTGIGNPALATPEKGRRFAQAVVERYVKLCCELVRGPIYQD